MYLLDTNVLSAIRRPDRAPQARVWLAACPDEDLYISAITLGEIEHGIRLQDKLNPDFAADLQA